jgi:hypothetical protein
MYADAWEDWDDGVAAARSESRATRRKLGQRDKGMPTHRSTRKRREAQLVINARDPHL